MRCRFIAFDRFPNLVCASKRVFVPCGSQLPQYCHHLSDDMASTTECAHTHRERDRDRDSCTGRVLLSFRVKPPCRSTVGGVVLEEEEEKGNNPTQHNPIQRYRQEKMETSNHHSTLYQEDTFAAVVFVAVGKIVSSWFPRGFCRLTTIGREKQEASLFKLLL